MSHLQPYVPQHWNRLLRTGADRDVGSVPSDEPCGKPAMRHWVQKFGRNWRAIVVVAGSVAILSGSASAETNDLAPAGWGFPGAYDVTTTYIDGGGDLSRSWGSEDELDWYGFVLDAPGAAERDLSAKLDPELPVLISFDLRYLKDSVATHNYLVIGADTADEIAGNSPNETNSLWFGFANDRFSVGTGTDFGLPVGSAGNGSPGGTLTTLFQSNAKTADANYRDDSRIRLRAIYDPMLAAVTHLQADYNRDGLYDEELFDWSNSPVDDVAAGGLDLAGWEFLSLVAKGNSRVDDISVTQRSLRFDFTDDGDVTVADVDQLCSAILAGGQRSSLLDLDASGLVDSADLAKMLREDRSFPGDADYNHRVEFNDFVILANNFGKPGNWSQADFNCDGQVDFPDFVALATNFGGAAAAPVNRGAIANTVPEPVVSTVLSLVMSLFFPWWRRHRE